LLRTLRQEHTLTVKQWAVRLGLPLERVRALEQDATLPTMDELYQLCRALDSRPNRLLRHVRGTGQALLDDAWTPYTRTHEAYAARTVPEAVASVDDNEAVLYLPEPLQRALCDALQVRRSDRIGLRDAWSSLRSEPDAYRSMLFDATLSQLTLEGETPYPSEP
jgi:transcriptional regulator with XRE-family HTH domain